MENVAMLQRFRVWGGVTPWRLWTCDPRCKVWEELTLET